MPIEQQLKVRGVFCWLICWCYLSSQSEFRQHLQIYPWPLIFQEVGGQFIMRHPYMCQVDHQLDIEIKVVFAISVGELWRFHGRKCRSIFQEFCINWLKVLFCCYSMSWSSKWGERWGGAFGKVRKASGIASTLHFQNWQTWKYYRWRNFHILYLLVFLWLQNSFLKYTGSCAMYPDFVGSVQFAWLTM